MPHDPIEGRYPPREPLFGLLLVYIAILAIIARLCGWL